MKLTIKESDLSSRYAGAIYRIQLMDGISNHGSVDVDFSAVEYVGPPFADEFFGVAAMVLGAELFKSSVNVLNISESCAEAMASAIDVRL